MTTKTKKRLRILALLMCPLLLIIPLAGCGQEKYPSRPITMIIPFGPGGATDLIARALEPKMEEKLGTDISAQNMPGGASSVGHQYVIDAEHDGYTILVQPTEITTMAVMEQLDTTYRDWTIIGVSAAVPAIFVVHPDSPFKTVEDFAAAMKEEALSVSVADTGCAWSRSTALLAQLTGGDLPELIPMGGGGPAAISAMKQEVDVGACGLPESVEYLTGGKLRALAYWGTEDLELEGYGTIPSIGSVYPELKGYLPYGGLSCMAVYKDTPKEISNTITEAFKFAVESAEFKKFLADNHFIEVGLTGTEATDLVAVNESLNSWLLYDLGFAAKNPEELGIPRAE